MAERATRRQPPAAPEGAAGVNDLDVLKPDGEVTIDGRVIVAREYRFFEGAKLRARSQLFFEELYALFNKSGSAPVYESVEDLLGAHEDAVVDMVALSTGCDPEWIRSLDDRDGDALMLTWWMANSGFFIRRVMRRAAAERFAQGGPSAGAGSTTSSSPPDTSAHPQTSNA